MRGRDINILKCCNSMSPPMVQLPCFCFRLCDWTGCPIICSLTSGSSHECCSRHRDCHAAGPTHDRATTVHGLPRGRIGKSGVRNRMCPCPMLVSSRNRCAFFHRAFAAGVDIDEDRTSRPKIRFCSKWKPCAVFLEAPDLIYSTIRACRCHGGSLAFWAGTLKP
jgi:hypothetical protein